MNQLEATPPIEKRIRILFVEDSEDDAALIQATLRKGGFQFDWERVQSAETMKAALARASWDMIISDYSMPGFDAIAAISVLKESQLDIPLIIVSGTVGEETAVKTMRAGAHDYLMKDNLTRLVPAVRRELQESEERKKSRLVEQELKNKEAQLLQSQKMEAIGSLAGGIAHDFNNLLNVILMACDHSDESRDDPSATANDIEIIRNTAKHAALLTRQLLIFSRKHTYEPKVLDLNAEVQRIDQMLRRMIGENIAFKLEMGTIDKPIRFDPSQLGQLALNLAVNARDAMPKGGELKISTREEKVDGLVVSKNGVIPTGDYAVLSVEDSGTGMDEKTESRIFEPFFTTKGDKGSGLGLATVFGIVKKNESYITLRTRLGAGTRFEIFIPLSNTREKPVEISEAAKAPLGKGETILVVEDQTDLRNVMVKSLRNAGYVVLEAANGSAAVSLLRSSGKAAKLVVCDLMMPGMTGKELVEAVSHERSDLKWLFVSGYTEQQAYDILPDAKRAKFLSKPFARADLLSRIRNLLDLAV